MKNVATNPVWDCCRIAFHTSIIDPKRVWTRLDRGLISLPGGWTMTETDCSGARSVIVVFDVEGFPTQEDAKEVRRQLAKIRNPRPKVCQK